MTDSAVNYFLAIDQGTSSSRAMIFDHQGNVVAKAQQDIKSSYPQNGWVEQDGREIVETVFSAVKGSLEKLPPGAKVRAMGITNQRETTLIWDRKTGNPICPAIVWQDRRTASLCESLKNAGLEKDITFKTGLLLDPYFSATKIKWILDHVPNARERAEKGELAFGTVDSFLLWHLTSGRVHATDVTNASRTLLYNIRDMAWDSALLEIFEIPQNILPEVQDCDHYFGDCDPGHFGYAIPINAMAGDQQSALIGQGCLDQGQVKCTFGTGGFIMVNIGPQMIESQNRLLTTVAYQIQGKKAYALEGSFFSAGSAVQWLRDSLKIIQNAHETEEIARSVQSSKGVYLVSAFSGLGAPHWQPEARGTLLGMTQATGVAEIVRATLESIGFQTSDLLEAMKQDTNMTFENLKVDGGMVANRWLLQFLADILQVPIVRAQVSETTAFGVAMLAAVGSGVFASLKDISAKCAYDYRVGPQIRQEESLTQKKNWKKAVEAACFYSTM